MPVDWFEYRALTKGAPFHESIVGGILLILVPGSLLLLIETSTIPTIVLGALVILGVGLLLWVRQQRRRMPPPSAK